MGFDNVSSFVKDHLREEAVAATVAGIAASIWLLKGREIGAASELILDAENATAAETDALHTEPFIGRNVPFGSSSLEQLQKEFGMRPWRPEVGPFSSTMPVSDRAEDTRYLAERYGQLDKAEQEWGRHIMTSVNEPSSGWSPIMSTIDLTSVPSSVTDKAELLQGIRNTSGNVGRGPDFPFWEKKKV